MVVDDERLVRLKELLDSDPDNAATHHLNLGVYLWDLGADSRADAVDHFVASAKLDPNNGAAFRYLGHYYSQVSVDVQRATKCYQRAVLLNPDDDQAGEGLCDLLDSGGMVSLQVSVCQEASHKSPKAFWAFRRLGYLLVHQMKWTEAVQSLQYAIRGYPKCADLWEALGVAYHRLGMFTAAIKSYGRSVELEDSRVFALVESGNIHLTLGSYQKGIELCRQALGTDPNNVAARHALAFGLLGFSKECIISGGFVWGASLLEEGCRIVEESFIVEPSLSSSWKLHGDIKLAHSGCLPWFDEEKNRLNDEESFKISIESWKKRCILTGISACRSYQKALHLTPWQANFYTDVAISLDHISLLEDERKHDFNDWKLPEKMALGALVLEDHRLESWIVLGSLSREKALKQHAFIRGLQLDASFSMAWACLGKVYRKEGEKLLAKQAFDHARSIDPSLALPWAGMAVDSESGGCSVEDAYECCLRAVQTLPIADFQIGLGRLALLSDQITSPQVFKALSQALQRAPFYPESHNLMGIVYEARGSYLSAVTAFRHAKCAVTFAGSCHASYLVDISINLARSLVRAGYASDAARECENLQKDGLLDERCQQIYALALWKTGSLDNALSVTRSLAKNISSLNHLSGLAAVELICKLLYNILGLESAATSVRKIPPELAQNSKIFSIISVFIALDTSGQLKSFLPTIFQYLCGNNQSVELHSLIATVKMIIDGSNTSLKVGSAVAYLKKVLHMHPDNISIRNQISCFLLQVEERMVSHKAAKCKIVEPPGSLSGKGSTSGYEVIGCAGVLCYSSCKLSSKFAVPSCINQWAQGKEAMHHLQRWLHLEPWNHKACYLLILNVYQTAREEKFPAHLCTLLRRLLSCALSKNTLSKEMCYNHYEMFQLLICASEVYLQQGDYRSCENYAGDVLQLPISSSYLFFAHLQLTRLYAAQGEISGLKNEYENCLKVGTDDPIGWICFRLVGSKYNLEPSDFEDLNFKERRKGPVWLVWLAIFDLVLAQTYLWNDNLSDAEKVLAHGCSLGVHESCIFLAHGAVCLELARQQDSNYVSHAINSLMKAQEYSPVSLPFISAIRAQAESSLGSKSKWERHLRFEWFSWPEEVRPAELHFQMHLLAKQHEEGSNSSNVELCQSPEKWVIRAVHMNPSCSRYWKVLQRLAF